MSLQEDLASASDPSTPEDELRRLNSLTSREFRAVRKAVAENMAAPKDVLADLFLEFPESVLQNPASALFDMDEAGPLGWVRKRRRLLVVQRIKAEFLHRFAQDRDAGVRTSLATIRHAPEDVLLQLATDPEDDVRAAVANNIEAPAVALRSLVKDPSGRVRRSLASNRSTPPEALHEMALDTDRDVRRMVSMNQSAWLESAKILANDPDPVVRSIAQQRIANEPR